MRPMKTRAAFAPLAVFVASLAVFSFCRSLLVGIRAEGVRATRAFAGDEPSYLLLAHSLAVDGDLNLHNNALNRDGRRFGVERCGGHIARRDFAGGEAWSIHTPGLPLLIAPVYALALRTGLSPRALACILLNLLAALLAVNTWLLCVDLAGGRASLDRPGCVPLVSPLLAVAAVVLTPPVIFYANLIYPELPAALLVLYAFRKALPTWSGGAGEAESRGLPPSPPPRFTGSLIISSLCVAFLPWLSFRFLLPALLLAAMHARRAWTDENPRRRAAALVVAAVPLAVSCALLLGFQQMAFGTWSFAGGYLHQGFGRTAFWARGGLNGLLGLALDQAVGMLAWSPVYLLAVPAVALLAREQPRRGWGLAALVLSLYLPESLYMHWWGGYAPPPRYIVAPAPLLGAALCYALSRSPGRSFTIPFALLLSVGILFGALGCAYPLTLYRHVHLLACFGVEISSRALPSFLHPVRSTWPLAFAWLFFIAALTAYYLSVWGGGANRRGCPDGGDGGR